MIEIEDVEVMIDTAGEGVMKEIEKVQNGKMNLGYLMKKIWSKLINFHDMKETEGQFSYITYPFV